ncbi:hypothetical protein AVEN_70783-1 [Araneus ventricosus]|uniref:Uncharacterized protein n=1 Tax=Araneus ventricosus TaxID=182803 RepID=A0A4Y2H9D2_ARAVE|nr:hypothetical protein AVEN_70783-1 [Araneus ventricosus]
MAQRSLERRAEETEERNISRLSVMAQYGQKRRAEEKEIAYFQTWPNVAMREEPKKQKDKEIADCQPWYNMQGNSVEMLLKVKIIIRYKLFMQVELFFTIGHYFVLLFLLLFCPDNVVPWFLSSSVSATLLLRFLISCCHIFSYARLRFLSTNIVTYFPQEM